MNSRDNNRPLRAIVARSGQVLIAGINPHNSARGREFRAAATRPKEVEAHDASQPSTVVSRGGKF